MQIRTGTEKQLSSVDLLVMLAPLLPIVIFLEHTILVFPTLMVWMVGASMYADWARGRTDHPALRATIRPILLGLVLMVMAAAITH